MKSFTLSDMPDKTAATLARSMALRRNTARLAAQTGSVLLETGRAVAAARRTRAAVVLTRTLARLTIQR